MYINKVKSQQIATCMVLQICQTLAEIDQID